MSTQEMIPFRRIEITGPLVVKFWSEMSRKYGSIIKSKSDSKSMAGLAAFLDAIGVIDRDKFLQNYATTIGGIVFVPFVIGEGTDRHTLWHQCQTCVHEHVHVLRSIKQGEINFALAYMFSRSDRADAEAEAYSLGMEFEFWWRGSVAGCVDEAIDSLKNYGLRDEDREYVRRYMQAREQTVKLGGRTSTLVQFAIDTIEALAKQTGGTT